MFLHETLLCMQTRGPSWIAALCQKSMKTEIFRFVPARTYSRQRDDGGNPKQTGHRLTRLHWVIRLNESGQNILNKMLSLAIFLSSSCKQRSSFQATLTCALSLKLLLKHVGHGNPQMETNHHLLSAGLKYVHKRTSGLHELLQQMKRCIRVVIKGE